MLVRVEGLSKSPKLNGRIGTIQSEMEGGRMRVVLDQDGKVLSSASSARILSRYNRRKNVQHPAVQVVRISTLQHNRARVKGVAAAINSILLCTTCTPRRGSSVGPRWKRACATGSMTVRPGPTSVCCAGPAALASRRWYIHYAYVYKYVMCTYKY